MICSDSYFYASLDDDQLFFNLEDYIAFFKAKGEVCNLMNNNQYSINKNDSDQFQKCI